MEKLKAAAHGVAGLCTRVEMQLKGQIISINNPKLYDNGRAYCLKLFAALAGYGFL
jgi:hypothetical protein